MQFTYSRRSRLISCHTYRRVKGCTAKVDDLDRSCARTHHHVVALNISMDHTARMQIRGGLEQLASVSLNDALGKRAELGEVGGESSSGDELKEQIDTRTILLNAQEADNVHVFETLQDIHLELHGREHLVCVLLFLNVELFYGDELAGAVHAAPDETERAFAN